MFGICFPFLPSRGWRGFGNIRRRTQGAAVFLIGRIRFLLGDKDFQAGLRCPFELILKDGFSLSFFLIFCQRLLRLDKGEDKAKQSKRPFFQETTPGSKFGLSVYNKEMVCPNLVALGYDDRSGFFNRTKIL